MSHLFNMETVQELLSELQRTVKVPKSQRNSFGNYNYRSCEDIVEAVKPLLPKGAHITLQDEIVLVGDRYYVKSTATLSYKDSGVFATAFAREQDKKLNKEGRETMDHSQITGSTSSYARKYALNGLLLIDDTKDADTQDNTEKKEVKPVAKPVSAKQKIVTLLKKLSYNTETKPAVENAVLSLTQLELDEANFDEIVSRLEVLVNEQK